MKPIREKRHRLDPEVYKGERIVSFTLCIKNKKSFFTSHNVYTIFNEMLLNEFKNYNCSAYVYLFMPDHLHLTVAGNDSGSDIKKCVDIFKQKTGFWFAQNHPEIKWQKDYYDHILRSKENLNIHIKYILNNPVRAGLVEVWKEYPFKGSTIYDLDEWASNW